MRIAAFDIRGPLPELQEPHAIAMLRPWIDVGAVGNLVMSRLESHLGATELGELAKPGNFFDFTRYRPVIFLREGQRQLAIPNTRVSYARRQTGNDFVFLHLLEPHLLSEIYVDSILLLFQRLGITRYYLLGSMYDYVPHTRPLLVTGRATGAIVEGQLAEAGVQISNYEGPSSITYLISQRLSEIGIETMSIIVHVPQYTQFDEDYMGQLRILEILNFIYGIPVDDADVQRAERQSKHIDEALRQNPDVSRVMEQLEAHYDAQAARRNDEEIPCLSPEVEKFLNEMNRRFSTG